MKALLRRLARPRASHQERESGTEPRIAVNANLDPNAAGGVQTNLLAHVRGLLAHPTGCRIHLIGTSAPLKAWRQITSDRMDQSIWPFPLNWYIPEAEKTKRLSTSALDWYARPADDRRQKIDRELDALNIDVVHFAHQVYFETSRPCIYEPWDLQHEHFPDFFSPEELAWRRDYYRNGCAQAHLIVTATAWTKSDLVARYGLDPNKIAVIYRDSHNVRAAPGETDRRRLLGQLGVSEGYALYPAATYVHKNHIGALRALAHLRDVHGLTVPLVCSGKLIEPQKSALERAIAELGLGAQIRLLGAVSDEQLAALYSGARFLFFPSLFEGLGLPVLEAFHHRLPVIAAASACLPEVIGDAGLLFDGHAPDSASDALRTFLTTPDLAPRLAAAGTKRLALFDWGIAAPTYQAAYKKLAGRTLTIDEAELLDKALAAA